MHNTSKRTPHTAYTYHHTINSLRCMHQFQGICIRNQLLLERIQNRWTYHCLLLLCFDSGFDSHLYSDSKWNWYSWCHRCLHRFRYQRQPWIQCCQLLIAGAAMFLFVRSPTMWTKCHRVLLGLVPGRMLRVCWVKKRKQDELLIYSLLFTLFLFFYEWNKLSSWMINEVRRKSVH